MKHAKLFIIALLSGITVFSVYKYIVSIRENSVLSENIRQLNSDVSALESEKEGLVKNLDREKQINEALEQANKGLKYDLSLSQEKLAKLEIDFQASLKTVEDLNSEVSLAKTENLALRDQVQGLQLDISQAKADREQLQARLSSIAELKKSIRELRRKARQARKETDLRILTKEKILGNSGFLIKDGKTTVKGKVKIEVEPLPVNP